LRHIIEGKMPAERTPCDVQRRWLRTIGLAVALLAGGLAVTSCVSSGRRAASVVAGGHYSNGD
jgi:hypothetical protein